MKLHYYPETDSLYIELTSAPGTEAREIVEGLVVDLDTDGKSSVSISTTLPASSICQGLRRLRCRRLAPLSDAAKGCNVVATQGSVNGPRRLRQRRA